MADRVTLRKAGWTADFINPTTGKRRQVVVESEEAGWALIQQESSAAAIKADHQTRTQIKQAPPPPTGSFSLEQSWELSFQRRFKGQRQARQATSYYRQAAKYFGSRTQLAAITSIWFQEWRQSLLDRGMKPAGVNRMAATLHAMRADALLFGKVQDLPMWPKSLRVTRIPPRFLSQDEIDRLVGLWAEKGDEQMIDLFLFRVSEGCRFEEAQRLTPRDVDLKADQVTFWKTKNGSPRTVPLVGVAREIVTRRMNGLGPDERLFTYSYGQWQERFKRATDELKLPGRVVGHTCRHTMAARAVTANVSTQLLKHWGGWRSTAALEHYAHLDTQGLKQMQKALESFQ